MMDDNMMERTNSFDVLQNNRSESKWWDCFCVSLLQTCIIAILKKGKCLIFSSIQFFSRKMACV